MANNSKKETFLKSMLRIRLLEEKIIELYPSDKIKSPVHLSIGQESVATAVCEALNNEDVVFATYRSHHVYLAKGGNINSMMAELFGKVTGCAEGKGGSMHLIDIDAGIVGTSAVVGTTVANAVGYALASKIKQQNKIIIVFFGDGAMDEGVMHESLNFAALKKLPIIFICENNKYAVHSHIRSRRVNQNFCDQVKTYGIDTKTLDGNNVFDIYNNIKISKKNILNKGYNPLFLEIMTYRWKEHVGIEEDFDAGYRDKKELKEWNHNDPIKKLSEQIKKTQLKNIESEIKKELEDAINFAEESPFPNESHLMKDIFSE